MCPLPKIIRKPREANRFRHSGRVWMVMWEECHHISDLGHLALGSTTRLGSARETMIQTYAVSISFECAYQLLVARPKDL